MADIELVIKLDEAYYEGCVKHRLLETSIMHIIDAISNGTPLPKGHGDLIDVNDLLDRIGLEDNDSNREENVGEIITLEDFDFIPTIIEADAESEE